MLKALTILGILAFANVASASKPKPPQMTIRIIAQTHGDIGGILQEATIYFILPDGTHATADCTSGYIDSPPCVADSFTPEKRKVEPCFNLKQTMQITCFTSMEAFYADRSGNILTVYGANGKVSYHIIGSWDDFALGTLPRPSHDPNWTAVCRDGTFSYSQQRSGTCSDHGGVDVWHP